MYHKQEYYIVHACCAVLHHFTTIMVSIMYVEHVRAYECAHLMCELRAKLAFTS